MRLLSISTVTVAAVLCLLTSVKGAVLSEHTSNYMADMSADRTDAMSKRMYYSCNYYYDECYDSYYGTTTSRHGDGWSWVFILLVCGPLYLCLKYCKCGQVKLKDKTSSSSDEDDKFKKAKDGQIPGAHGNMAQPGFNTYG